ncbi:lactate/malate dehydrogenase [Aspergillus recurvatus]
MKQGMQETRRMENADPFDEIGLYGIVHVPGTATDLMHIGTRARVTRHLPGDSGLKKALTGADIVVVTAGIARKPGMPRDSEFNATTNASNIRDLFAEIAATCPNAVSCVVTNPVNSTLPVAAETIKKAGVFEPTRLFGITALDVMRASTFAAHALDSSVDPRAFKVPVIGGHSIATILLYSQAEHPVDPDKETLAAVIRHVQFGGDSVTEEAYVYPAGIAGGQEIARELGVDYFALKVTLSRTGAAKALPVAEISEDESKLSDVAIKDLKANSHWVYTGIQIRKR